MNRPPNRVTIHRGMLFKKSTRLIRSTMSWGSAVPVTPDKPDWVITVETIPCMMENRASMRSSPYPTAAFAKAKRSRSLNASSGLFISARPEQVLTTPTAKNKTSRPYPMAFSAPLISSITFQIPPPLKVSGS